MSTLDFLPEVWTCDGFPPMLVCGRRWAHPPAITGAAKDTFPWISHPVAILLKNPPAVCLGFKTGEGDTAWTRQKPEESGIPSRAAALALAEAWRCVKMSINPLDFSGHAEIDAKKLVSFRNGVIFRNIVVWLAWGHWEIRKATFEERRADIESQGFMMTPKAFSRLLEDAGMSI